VNPRPRSITASELKAWLVSYLAQLLGVDERQVDPAFSFELYGLDSSAAVGLSGDLGLLLGREIDVSIAYDHPTIDALVEQFVVLQAVAPE
jgi:acyl carrier protein